MPVKKTDSKKVKLTTKSAKKKISKIDSKHKKLENKIVKLNETIQNITDDTKKLKEKNIRLLAEFDNYKRRTAKEKTRIMKYASEGFAKSLLTVMDDFQRMVKSISETSKVSTLKDGISMVKSKFDKVLIENGIIAFESINKPFDTDYHEALMNKESDEVDEGIVLEEFEKGFKYHDRIIRHAKVIVSKAKSK